MDEMTNFRKYAIEGGITAPLCDEYRTLWRGCGKDKNKLIRLGLRQQSIPYLITHCQRGYGLSKEYLLNNFGEYINESTEKATIMDCDEVKGYSYSLYVDFKGSNKRNTDVSCIMWSSVPMWEIKRAKAQILYIGCNSHVNLSLDGFNNLTIYLFDTSSVTFDDMDDTSDVLIYKFTNECKVEYGKYFISQLKNIKQYDKELIL